MIIYFTDGEYQYCSDGDMNVFRWEEDHWRRLSGSFQSFVKFSHGLDDTPDDEIPERLDPSKLTNAGHLGTKKLMLSDAVQSIAMFRRQPPCRPIDRLLFQ